MADDANAAAMGATADAPPPPPPSSLKRTADDAEYDADGDTGRGTAKEEDAEDDDGEKQPRQRNVDDDDELDEEDLELIAENLGVQHRRPDSNFKRLKRKDDRAAAANSPKQQAGNKSASLEDLFADDDDDDEGQDEQVVGAAVGRRSGASYGQDDDQEEGEVDDGAAPKHFGRGIYDAVVSDDDDDENDGLGAADHVDDDLDDFIVDDDNRLNDDDRRRQQRRQRASTSSAANGRAAAGSLKLAQELGISEQAWNEVYELFGDGSDYAYAQPLADHQPADSADSFGGNQADKRRPKSLGQIYEPAEVSEKMFTDKDDLIRARDLPERFQLRDDLQHRTPDSEEIVQEAKWIASHLKRRDTHREIIAADHPVVLAIGKVLHFLRIDNLEVPFIARHRVDYFHGRLDRAELWEVAELDERWNHIIDKKRAIRAWSPVVPEFSTVFAQVLDEDGVKDLSDYLQLRYKREMEEWKSQNSSRESLTDGTDKEITSKKLKRPVRKDLYILAKDANLGDFAQKFGITPDQFGENFSAGLPRNIAEDNDKSPEDLANDFKCSGFNSASAVLHAARHMLAQEIATNLQVRSTLRDLMFQSATVTVTPTERGRPEIDEMHEFYPFKYLKHKPVARFHDDQYLMLERADKEGLLVVELSVRMDELRRKYEMHYCNDNFSAVAEKWNQQRRMVLKMAFEETLIPLVKRWLHERLINDAIDYVSEQCQRTLRARLEVGPYRKRRGADKNGHDDEHNTGVRVFAVSCGGGEANTAAFGVLLNEAGAAVDHLKLNSIHGRDRDAKERDLDRVADFLQKYSQVDVVAVAGWTLATRYLHDDLDAVVRRAYGDRYADTTVAYVNDDCARIYQNSRRSTQDFPAYPPLLKYCISLGRSVQEPLFEYAALFNADKEVLFLKLNPLQDRVPPERQFRGLERVMMTAVNEVGVDINRALASPHAATPLQLVCGLGPRKAGSLLVKIRAKYGVLESRADLVRDVQMGKCVFMNCASFIRITAAYIGSRRSPTEVLDSTRIHPEDYAISRKIAADALEIEEIVDSNNDDDENPSRHVEEIMQEPAPLEDLMLEEFAKILLQDRGEEKHICLEYIKAELTEPFKDVRRGWTTGASDADVFTMLTGENDRTLAPGMLVGCVVTRLKDRLVTVRLDSGLDGMIAIRNLSDRSVQSTSDAAFPGQALRCRVMQVFKEKFLVELSAVVDNDDDHSSSTMKVDTYFDREKEQADLAMQRSSRNKEGGQSRGVQQRPIQHPQFHNMDVRAAEEYLASCPAGELIFRPSSRGNHRLTLSWKVADGIYQHLQIEELRKDSEFALGKELKIDDLSFSDLDEIAALYVEPMARFVRELRASPKFVPGKKDDLHRHVEREMLANPKRIPYVFGFSEEQPGKFWLVYRLGLDQEPRHESIAVGPQGYTFRRCQYRELNSLLNAFKATQFASAERPTPRAAESSSNAYQPPAPPAAAPRPAYAPPGRPPVYAAPAQQQQPLRYPVPPPQMFPPSSSNPMATQAGMYGMVPPPRPMPMMPPPPGAPYGAPYPVPAYGRPPMPMYGQLPPQYPPQPPRYDRR